MTAIGKAPLGVHLNNPGNIKASKTPWVGKKPIRTGQIYEEYETMPYGVRASAKLLLTYYRKYGLMTVSTIIDRWAPEEDLNPTAEYISAVSDWIGVAPNQQIDVTDPEILQGLCRSIFRFELGRRPDGGDWVSEADLRSGVAMALA